MFKVLKNIRRLVFKVSTKKLANVELNVIFEGCLGEYKYYDMDVTIATILDE